MKSDLPDRTFAFAERIVKLCLVLEQNGRVSATLANQLLRSGTSIGANVEEGQASQSKADFVSKQSLAKKLAKPITGFVSSLQPNLFRQIGSLR